MRFLAALVGMVLVAAPAKATWSIVVVDLKTREVCSATATCIEGMDLDLSVPLVVVGKGAAAAQAFVHSGAKNRKVIFSGSGRALARLLTQGASAGVTKTSGHKLDLELVGAGGPLAIGVTRIRRDGRLRDV